MAPVGDPETAPVIGEGEDDNIKTVAEKSGDGLDAEHGDEKKEDSPPTVLEAPASLRGMLAAELEMDEEEEKAVEQSGVVDAEQKKGGDDGEEDSTMTPKRANKTTTTTNLPKEENEDGNNDNIDIVAKRPSASWNLEDRVREMVTEHDEAWLMLATRLGLPRIKAIETTTQTSIELVVAKMEEQDDSISGGDHSEELQTVLEDKVLEGFCDQYLLDPDGVRELFQRSMFKSFDFKKKGVIGKESIMQWLNHAYSISPSMRGGRVLPPRLVLQTKLLNKLTIETKKKGGLNFEDIHECVMEEIAKMEFNNAKMADNSNASNTNGNNYNKTKRGTILLDPIFPERTWNKECDFCNYLGQQKVKESDFCSYLDRKWADFWSSKK